MNTIGKLILVGFLPLFLLNSCIDTDIDPVGYGDAFILVEISGQDTLMGLGLHAFSYSEFTSVNVQLSSDVSKSYVLQPYLGYAQDFVWSTPRNEYTRALPGAGDYVFNATFRGGHTQVFYDKLYATVVYPPKITKCVYNTNNQKVEVEWDRVSNADSYNVKLLNSDGEMLFVSPVFNRITDIYIFDKNSQGWQTSSYPTVGQNITVEVASYLLETGTTGNELQSVGKSRQVITWGN
jgi:hypothetical protein